MAPGTSPSLSDLGEVAVQGSNGNLWTVGLGGFGDTSQPMSAGTSPSIHSPAGWFGYSRNRARSIAHPHAKPVGQHVRWRTIRVKPRASGRVRLTHRSTRHRHA
jgi:hypothetical protein